MTAIKNAKILLTGGHGFLGTRVLAELMTAGAQEKNIRAPRSKNLDLRQAANCEKAVKGVDIIIHLAANVGGIGYNQQHPGQLFYDNAVMGIHLIEAARKAGIKKFVQIGTVCAYPKVPRHIPFYEDDLWQGYPEETNAPYGLAKLMLLEMLQAYRRQYGFNGIYLLPTNLYGPGDNFNVASSHVIPALIKKFEDAIKNNQKAVSVWGSGQASREFLFVDDAARGIVLAVMNYDKPEPVNLGSNQEIAIKDLVQLVAQETGYEGKIIWDKTKPDGQPRRKLNVTRAKKEFGFVSKVSLKAGLCATIGWYRQKDKNYKA